MTGLLNVSNLTTGYRGQRVLTNISFDVDPGTVTAIIGPNGHGKSTLLKCLSGLLASWSGDVRFEGDLLNPGAPDRARKGLTLVPQGDQLFSAMTVEENLKMGAFVRSDKVAIRKSLDEVYTLFPRLSERKSQRAESLSGGERRMVGIGRGMMANGKLIMIDEPSLGLAPLIIEQIYVALGKIATEERSILVVEENPSRVSNVADTFFLMDGGQFVWTGDQFQLDSSPDILNTYLGATV